MFQIDAQITESTHFDTLTEPNVKQIVQIKTYHDDYKTKIKELKVSNKKLGEFDTPHHHPSVAYKAL